MAIYHCSIKNIGRSNGRSAVACAAYRAGEKLKELETGLWHDYTRKTGIEYKEIILCKNAPKEWHDRAKLWNEVQAVEKASNARLAREWEVAIPKELTLEQGQKLVHDFAQSLADEGMCIDIAIHDKRDGNRHAHIMGTTRPIKENGTWGAKEKKAYALDEKGERIPVIDEKTGLQKVRARKGKGEEKLWQRVTVEANDWNKPEKIEEWRARWAAYCNRYLEKENQIDHRSYARQGIEQKPTIHEGYASRKMEARGYVSDRAEANREIREDNRLIRKLSQEIKELEEQVKEVMQEKAREINARLSKYRRTLRHAGGTRPEDRRAASGAGTAQQPEPAERAADTDALLREARAIIDAASTVGEVARTDGYHARTEEADSRARRAAREAERERLSASAEREVERGEPEISRRSPEMESSREPEDAARTGERRAEEEPKQRPQLTGEDEERRRRAAAAKRAAEARKRETQAKRRRSGPRL